MPSGNGFLTISPDATFDSLTSSVYTSLVRAQRFLLPQGTWEVTEIGIYVSSDAGFSCKLHLGIFEDDDINGCPSVLVDNSDSGELYHNTTTITKISHNYSTRPILTAGVGGTYFWLAHYYGDDYANWHYRAAVVTGIYKSFSYAYPTWPTDTQWHTHTDRNDLDAEIYAVYKTKESTMIIGSMLHIG